MDKTERIKFDLYSMRLYVQLDLGNKFAFQNMEIQFNFAPEWNKMSRVEFVLRKLIHIGYKL